MRYELTDKEWTAINPMQQAARRTGGAEAFKRDIPNATVRFFDTRHFAPETHAPEVAAAIRGFLP
jgi:hypothetical protein